MKLYPILYEAAQSVEGSLGKGIAAFALPGGVALVSTRRVLESLRGRIKKSGVPSYLKPKNPTSPEEDIDDRMAEDDDDWDERTNFEEKLADSLSNNAVVGSVTYHSAGTNAYKVDTSSGVNKFGPLAYQLVMFVIQPAWLKSDSSLKEGSQGVWNKMYQRGDVEKKWVGSFGGSPAVSYDNLESSIVSIPRNEKPANDGVTITKGTKELLKIYLNNIHPTAPTEDVFLDFLRDNNIDINDHGNFYAYRTTTGYTGPVKTMFDLGDQMKEYMITKLEATSDAVSEAFRMGSNKHFSRMYT